MAKRILSYLLFTVLMVFIISGSLIVIVALYLPLVVIKAVVLTATGKAKPKVIEGGGRSAAV